MSIVMVLGDVSPADAPPLPKCGINLFLLRTSASAAIDEPPLPAAKLSPPVSGAPLERSCYGAMTHVLDRSGGEQIDGDLVIGYGNLLGP